MLHASGRFILHLIALLYSLSLSYFPIETSATLPSSAHSLHSHLNAAAVVVKPLGPKICLTAQPPAKSLTVVEARYKIDNTNWDLGLIPRVSMSSLHCMHIYRACLPSA